MYKLAKLRRGSLKHMKIGESIITDEPQKNVYARFIACGMTPTTKAIQIIIGDRVYKATLATFDSVRDDDLYTHFTKNLIEG